MFKKFSFILLVLFTFGIASQLYSQTLQDMTVSFSDGTYSEMTGGTYLVGGDDGTVNVYFPFDFKWDGKTYTANSSTFLVSCNGGMVFNPGTFVIYWNLLNQSYPSIQAFKGDLYNVTVTGGVTGSAPNRVLILQWANSDIYNWCGNGANINFQIRLYETSNKAEVIFGNMNAGGYGWCYNFLIGFTGSSTSYINILPGPTTWNAYYSSINNASPVGPNQTVDQAHFGYVSSGKTITVSAFPSLAGTYPSTGTILQRGQIYSGAQQPAMYFNRQTGHPNVYGKYRISGPLPADVFKNKDYKTIYIGTASDYITELFTWTTQPVGAPAIATINYAKGIAAGTNGALDLQTNASQIVGGEYVVEAEMQLPTFNYVQRLDPQTFVIALQNDIAITSLSSPKQKIDRKYPLSTQIPIQFIVTNLGITTYQGFTVRGIITDNITGDTVYNNLYTWPPSGQTGSLTTGQFVNISMPNYRPITVTDFKLTLFLNPTNPEADDEWTNNYYPRSPAEFIFATAHEIEAEALDILVPGDSVFVGRPIIPIGRFRNNGVSDISDIPAKMWIVKMVPPYDTVYRDNIIIQDIPQGRYNLTDALFSSNFIPPSAGQYKACISIRSIDDPITSNDIFCKLFRVVDAMAGTYTIGTTMSGSRNFATIQDALNALYLRGVTGPVTFELTDANYYAGDINLTYPAMDMSAKIIGVDSRNTITFKPSQSKALYKGSVTINLYSGAGVGIYIGQNLQPNNIFAAVNYVTSGLKKVYAKSSGYINFDGGSQKSLKFKLYTNLDFNAVFYLGTGASNNSVKNTLVETYYNLCNYDLPKTKYDVSLSSFSYEENYRNYGSFTTGILLRSTYPKDKNENSNVFRLDTVVCANNLISGNEIYGFAYGITSLGIGPLFNEGQSKYIRYYNTNNTITGNTIHDVCRAAIYLGHEENSIISMNKIYKVTAAAGNDAYGILAGGEGNSKWFGYNNIGLKILGNEINDVSSPVLAGGIKIEQTRNAFPFANPPFVFFPDIPEASKVGNNAIWDLKTTDPNGSKFGIYLLTTRKSNANWMTQLITPFYATYYSRNDEVCNNTVWLRSDQNGIVVDNAIVGIGLQQVQNAKLYNNAVAMTDEEISLNIKVNAGYMLQGTKPANGSLTSDRNAFYSSDGADASYFHFFEMDNLGSLVENGKRFDYRYLDQWQNWTHQDYNSVVGNFTTDYVFLGNAPNQQLRVVNNPTPLGSILNNRGNIISWVTTDIDDEPRGAAGQRYDIGHDEFNGRLYLSDMEAIKIVDPVAYQAGDGFFSDAEYIMTTAPVNVKGLFRNSGNLPQNGVTATLYIYRELPNGLYSNVPELTTTTLVSAQTTESVIADWKLSDGVAPDWVPQTYADLLDAGYVPPEQFSTMKANITPKYKITIVIGADQNNTNNSKTKIVRFYLQRANLRMVLSAENSFQILDANSTGNEIAGQLNYTALVNAFATLGWKINLSTKQFDYDVFDRLGWEPKAVDYSMYRTMFWSDGDDAPTTRYQRIDMMNFLSGGNLIEKKNLIIGSQEMVREHMTGGIYEDVNFIGGILRSNYAAPGNPLGVNVSNDGNRVIGISIGRNYGQDIDATPVTNDPAPYCGLVSIYPNGEGLSTGAFKYVNHTAAPSDSLTGVTTTSLTRNVCYYGVDWRHWAKLNYIVRGSIDYIEKNGGTIIPVELTSFDAVARGKQVDLSWMTASEYNSDKFEIEKASKLESGLSSFVKIAEVKAIGQSTKVNTYGPIADKDILQGSTYVYRLRIIDNSGEYSYSDEREVKIGGDNTSWLGSAVPNPVVNESSVDYSVAESGQVNIAIYDLNGKFISTIYSGYSNAGTYNVRFSSADLADGTYSIVMNINNQQYTTYIQVVK